MIQYNEIDLIQAGQTSGAQLPEKENPASQEGLSNDAGILENVKVSMTHLVDAAKDKVEELSSAKPQDVNPLQLLKKTLYSYNISRAFVFRADWHGLKSNPISVQALLS